MPSTTEESFGPPIIDTNPEPEISSMADRGTIRRNDRDYPWAKGTIIPASLKATSPNGESLPLSDTKAISYSFEVKPISPRDAPIIGVEGEVAKAAIFRDSRHMLKDFDHVVVVFWSELSTVCSVWRLTPLVDW